MYRTAVIGRQADILGFMALGFKVVPVNTAEEAGAELLKLGKSGQYAVIFVAEDFAPLISPQIASFADDVIPAVVTIPTSTADNGFGMNQITDSVKKAVGADIK